MKGVPPPPPLHEKRFLCQYYTQTAAKLEKSINILIIISSRQKEKLGPSLYN